MLTQKQELFIINTAKRYLIDDRQNPDVGMGLSTNSAVTLAIRYYIETAELFLPNSKMVVEPLEKTKIEKEIENWRKVHNI